MATIVNITKKGHKCTKPFNTVPASYIKAGERLTIDGFELSYDTRQKAYNVHQNIEAWGRFDNYQYSNFNCAVNTLVQLATSAKA